MVYTRAMPMYDNNDAMFNKAAEVLLTGGVWKSAAHFGKNKNKDNGKSWLKEGYDNLKYIGGRVGKYASGVANAAVEKGKEMAVPHVVQEIVNKYNAYNAANPYMVPGLIAGGTGLLSTAAAGKATTGLTTALGALGGWYGGQHLAEKYGNEITDWTANKLGKDYAPIGKALTPILTAGAGSLLGAMIG